MHRVTEWRRRKKADKGIALPPTGASSHPDRNGRSRGVKRGRHLAQIERANDADYLAFACAVAGELVETGEARLGNLKSFTRIKGGPHAGESTVEYQARRLREADSQVNPAPVPSWRDCPSPQKEAIMSCREFSPAILALAAVDLGQFLYLRKIGAELQARELDLKSIEDAIREREPDMREADLMEIVKASLENPEIARVYLGASDLTKYYHGHSARRESSQASSPSAVMKSQGIDISRRMVCHYRKKPEFMAAKSWLRQLVGRRVVPVPVGDCELALREDLRSVFAPYSPAGMIPGQINRERESANSAN